MTRGKAPAPQRPRTRAYAKLHGLSIKDEFDAATAAISSLQSSKYPPQSKVQQTINKTSENHKSTQTQTVNKTSENHKSTQTQTINKTSENHKSTQTQSTRLIGRTSLRSRAQSAKIKGVQDTQQAVSDRSAPQFDAPQAPSQGRVSAWLDILDPSNRQISSPSRPASHSEASVLPLDADGMESSSSINTSRSTTNDEVTTIKASTVKDRRISFREHLEFRGIMLAPENDPKLQDLDLAKKIDDIPSHLEFRSLDSLLRVLDGFSNLIRKAIQERGAENGLPTYDALRYQVSQWRPDANNYRRFPPMPPEEFDWDREQCFNSSEADFHRTIMISIIDRHDLRNTFAFSCEEQWGVDHRFLIPPTRSKSKISQPKPDLALSFQRSALIDDDLLDFPIELAKCLHPGISGHDRWFPFVFIEAKKDDNSLRDAFEKALYAASQALFNIYQWMRLVPQLEEKFFDRVRVFSIVLNNETITLRLHRAVRGSNGRLRYKFALVTKINDYNRFEACHMVKSVLVDYGLPLLYPLLKSTYQTVAQMDDQQGEKGAKRKQQATRDSLDLLEAPQEAPQPNPVLASSSTGISFDADNLDISATGSNPKRARREKRDR